MLLIDFLSVCDENKTVYVILAGTIVSWYDGKNSIDPVYNDCPVVSIGTESGCFIVEIE